MKKAVSILSDYGDLDSRVIEMDMIVDFSHSWLIIWHGWSNKDKKNEQNRSEKANQTHHWRQNDGEISSGRLKEERPAKTKNPQKATNLQ